MRDRRIGAILLGSSFSACLPFCVLFFLRDIHNSPNLNNQIIGGYIKDTIGMLVFGWLVIALPYALILGLPLFFLFEKLGFIKWWTAILAGFWVGAAPLLLFSTSFSLLFGISGMVGALVGYFINNHFATKR